jgi:hypothetical protein
MEARTPALSPTTIRYCYTVLRIALGAGRQARPCHRYVATLIDPPALARREVAPMSGAEARAFLATVAGDRFEALYHDQLRPLVRVPRHLRFFMASVSD